MSVSGPQRDSRSKAKVCGLLQLVIEGARTMCFSIDELLVMVVLGLPLRYHWKIAIVPAGKGTW